MKVALLADIHGNYAALQAVLNALPPVDNTFVVGDVLGYYPHFAKCLEALEPLDPVFVCGNHEAFQRGDLPQPKHPLISTFCSHFNRTAAPEHKAWLKDLPHSRLMSLDGAGLMIAHGSPWRLDHYVRPENISCADFAGLKDDIIVLGHTHVPMAMCLGDKLIVNPGSVGQPRDHDHRASCAVLDCQRLQVDFMRVPYDCADMASDLQAMGYGPAEIKVLMQKLGQ
jgi:putative phosphoesterase